MVERQRTTVWRATFWRTATIAGYAYGVPLSVVLVVGVHAAVMRELGRAWTWAVKSF